MSIEPALSDMLSAEEKGSIHNMDRMLPSQPFMRKFFNGDSDAFHKRLELLLTSALPARSVEQKWVLELKPGVTYASLGSDISTLHFYQLLIRLGGIRSVLELGTYIGGSTLFLAEAVGAEGMVTTVERGEEFYEIARRNFLSNGMEKRIHSVLGSAGDVLCRFADEKQYYDMIVLDAAKEEYAVLFERALRCLCPGGLLVVDDVFMNGDALNEQPRSEKGRGVHQLLGKVNILGPEYTRVVLPFGNGTLLLLKPL